MSRAIRRRSAYPDFVLPIPPKPSPDRKLSERRRDACRHSGGATQRLVNAGKVVMHRADRDRMRVVLGPFAQRIDQPREPARSHPQ